MIAAFDRKLHTGKELNNRRSVRLFKVSVYLETDDIIGILGNVAQQFLNQIY